MRKLWKFVSLPGLAVAVFLLWLFWPIPNPMEELQEAEEFILYSIDGREESRIIHDNPPIPKLPETFRKYPVLGKVKIDKPEERRKLIAGFKDAVTSKPWIGAKCFWPRHGIRALVNGKTVEYVICFECDQYYRSEKDALRKEFGYLNRDKNVQPVFDKPLTDASIPIAPK